MEYNEKIQELSKDNKEITPLMSVKLMTLLVSLTCVDENGNLLFTADDVEQLSNASLSTLIALSTKALEISGIQKKVINEVASQLGNVENSSSTEN